MWRGATIADAMQANENLQAWKDYAAKLEQAILNLRRVDKGHRELEKALIADLRPGSQLADKNRRQNVFNAGFQNAKVTVQGD